MGALKDVLAKKAALDGNYNPSHAYEVYPDWHEKAGQRVAEEDMAELAEQEANRASHVDYKAREQARQKLAKLVQAMHDEVFVLQERMGDMERKLAEQRRVIVVNENKQELYASANAVHKAFAPVLKRRNASWPDAVR
jgi:membrane-associated HD superfamily phosphohydrolase